MTTTRYFEVKVTGCKNCIHAEKDGFGSCSKAYWQTKSITVSYQVFNENRYQLTPSCPMWNETKESETKCTSVKHS